MESFNFGATMNLRTITLNFYIDQEILVGIKEEKAKITKIEYHEKSGDVIFNTTKGPIKALNFKLIDKTNSDDYNPADKYR